MTRSELQRLLDRFPKDMQVKCLAPEGWFLTINKAHIDTIEHTGEEIVVLMWDTIE